MLRLAAAAVAAAAVAAAAVAAAVSCACELDSQHRRSQNRLGTSRESKQESAIRKELRVHMMCLCEQKD